MEARARAHVYVYVCERERRDTDGQAPVAASEAIIILSSRDQSGVFGNCMELINTDVTLLYLGCNRVYKLRA